MAPVSSKDVAKFYAKGNSMRETAAMFGISVERIRQLLRRDYPQLIRQKSRGMGLSPSVRLTNDQRR